MDTDVALLRYIQRHQDYTGYVTWYTLRHLTAPPAEKLAAYDGNPVTALRALAAKGYLAEVPGPPTGRYRLTPAGGAFLAATE